MTTSASILQHAVHQGNLQVQHQPSSRNSIHCDETMKPPIVKQPTQRLKKKCMRKRKMFINTDESPITCSICGLKGHNKRSVQQKRKYKKISKY